MIPDFQSVMLPLLKIAGDGRIRKKAEYTEILSKEFQLTEDELSQKIPSGWYRFDNRVGWVISYLRNAGLLQSPQRGITEISQRGRDVLAAPPEKITINFLKQYEEFNFENARPIAKTTPAIQAPEIESGATPEEIIDSAFSKIQERLADEILDSVKKCSWTFLEQLVVDLILAMGYGGSKSEAGMAIGRSGDEGIDGIINEDKLGLDVIYLQAKKWEGKVGRPEIQKFVGALSGKRSKKGIFITTSEFTKEADDYARNIDFKIILIDGKRLANLMIEHNVGVSTAATYQVKKIDSDFFQE